MKTTIEDKIKKGMKRVLLYGEPRHILLSVKAFQQFRKENKQFGEIVFNGGDVSYMISVDLNECPRMSQEWKDYLHRTFYLGIIVSRYAGRVEVLADVGNEYAQITESKTKPKAITADLRKFKDARII